MNGKKKGLPAGFDKDFKKLSVKERIRVLFVTRKLLKVQREKKELLGDVGEGYVP
ncbi:MAG: hypothetical protein LBQ82_09435 [Treponema sp.]|jgi:hypothetical protein|nr:hypothetical protein [Treponema sp.]